ncbi:MAG: potassium-transporting ATPase subunit KdpA [Acidobacteria bacterium]|nr:potassium-transporting ATPase subunit KdpA [Acidobacteriota bacterium]MBV9475380.1 potassium-transporting ATPase subunit KdpA [Acidobacteriota bacterium]
MAFTKVALFFLLVAVTTKPIGLYMRRVFCGERTFLDPLAAPLERLIHRLAGIDAKREQSWQAYALAMLAFSMIGLVLTYALLRLQHVLPLNPDHLGAVGPDLAWNTAVSFTTNTDWQAYVGESTMSQLSQMAALAFHNFASAATGIAVAIAVIRGVARQRAATLGNFWVDLVRATLWILLPLSLVAAIVLLSQGVVQNFDTSTRVRTLEGATQAIAQGPVASQEAIKELGTNGGGFFNANSAHPYENPTPFTNLFEMFLILWIAAGLTYTLGSMTGKPRHGWAVFAAMSLLFLAMTSLGVAAEIRGNPLHHLGPNLEGKETRFGAADSALFASVTTAASCGAVNAMHDSFTPLGGFVPLANILLGEVVFGGAGAGLYGIFVFIILAVFIAGLMVGRTPEYLGKKIEAKDVKLAMLTVLIFALFVLAGSALATATNAGRSSISNAGPHGLSQMAYAYTSAAGNNGSAFAGLNANTRFYNIGLGLAMFFGRFFMIIPVLGIAGSLAAKKRIAESAGTFPVDGALFAILLAGVIVIVGALTYFPMLSLGPVVEHFVMQSGKVFG